MDLKKRYNRLQKNCFNCQYIDKSRFQNYTVNNLRLERYGCNRNHFGWSMGFDVGKDSCDGSCDEWAVPDKERIKYKEFSILFGQELCNSIIRWCNIDDFGCNDPFFSDGTNMNLVRNHIIFWCKECERYLLEADYPIEYYIAKTPPEKDINYMARKEEIRRKSIQSLQKYLDDPCYNWCKDKKSKLSKKELDALCYDNVMSYPIGLKQAIDNDDLVAMRRHENPQIYLKSFADLEKRLKEKIQESKDTIKPAEQLNLFSAEKEGVYL